MAAPSFWKNDRQVALEAYDQAKRAQASAEAQAQTVTETVDVTIETVEVVAAQRIDIAASNAAIAAADLELAKVVKIYRTATAPTGTIPENSVWYDGANGNIPMVRVGGAWVSIRDAGVTKALADLITANTAISNVETTAANTNIVVGQQGTDIAANNTAIGGVDSRLVTAKANLEAADVVLNNAFGTVSSDVATINATTIPQSKQAAIAEATRLDGLLKTATLSEAETKAAALDSTAKTATLSAAAATAQTKAEAEALAAKNAAIAASGKIIRQVSAPTGANANVNNLWIDITQVGGVPKNTPNAYDGTNWVPITDKAVADAKAAAISTAQSDATTKANNAKAAAITAAGLAADTKIAQAKTDTLVTAANDALAKANDAKAAAISAAAADAQTKADAALAAATTQVNALESRGTDLVVNGTGSLEDNTNFPSFIFDPTDAPVGAVGSFVAVSQNGSQPTEDLIPIDPTKRYQFSYSVRQRTPGNQGRFYSLIVPRDAYKNFISVTHYHYQPGSLTTLAAELKSGDTTVTLTSAANWNAVVPYAKYIQFWDYVDPGGKLWAPLTYTRNVIGGGAFWPDNGINGNVITLSAPYSGPTKAVGTKVSNGKDGRTYLYGQANVIASEEWTHYTAALVAGVTDGSLGAATFSTGIPPGTAYGNLGWLVNREAPGSEHAFGNVSFSDASAAQETADSKASPGYVDAAKQSAIDSATTMTNNINRAYESTAVPTSANLAAQGSIWRRTDSNGRYIGAWTQTASGIAGTWTPRLIDSQIIDNLDVGKLSASSAVINSAVLSKVAAGTASIQTADIAHLFVTGTSTLSTVVAKSIATRLLTSNVFQTSDTVGAATNGQGMRHSTAGSVYYNSSGVPMTSISAATGRVTAQDVDIAGKITATSGTITGILDLNGTGVLRTGATGKRMQFGTSGLYGYNATAQTFAFDTATGLLSAVGATMTDLRVSGVGTILGRLDMDATGIIRLGPVAAGHIDITKTSIISFAANGATPVTTWDGVTGKLTASDVNISGRIASKMVIGDPYSWAYTEAILDSGIVEVHSEGVILGPEKRARMTAGSFYIRDYSFMGNNSVGEFSGGGSEGAVAISSGGPTYFRTGVTRDATGDSTNNSTNMAVNINDAGAVQLRKITGTGTNMTISSDGWLGRSTSTRAVKDNIGPLGIDTYAIYDHAEPVRYQLKSEIAAWNTRTDWIEGKSPQPFKPIWYAGLIADDMADGPLDIFVERDPLENELSGVRYASMVTGLILAGRADHAEIASLKSRLTALEGAK